MHTCEGGQGNRQHQSELRPQGRNSSHVVLTRSLVCLNCMTPQARLATRFQVPCHYPFFFSHATPLPQTTWCRRGTHELNHILFHTSNFVTFLFFVSTHALTHFSICVFFHNTATAGTLPPRQAYFTWTGIFRYRTCTLRVPRHKSLYIFQGEKGRHSQRIRTVALVPEPTVWVIPTFVIVRRSHSS